MKQAAQRPKAKPKDAKNSPPSREMASVETPEPPQTQEEPPMPAETVPAPEAVPATEAVPTTEAVPATEAPKEEEEFTDLDRELKDLLKEYDREKDKQVDVQEPNLFDRPQQFEQIVTYRQELEKPIEERYLEGFERDVQDDALLVGAITLGDVQVSPASTGFP